MSNNLMIAAINTIHRFISPATASSSQPPPPNVPESEDLSCEAICINRFSRCICISNVIAIEKYAYSMAAYVNRYGMVTIGAKTLIPPIIRKPIVTKTNNINALIGTK
ncbi:hypothetical protein DERF_005291 [Dermatophagoides farinae]|uniref:Uncharacterized protein n=1 Tax=Dermatophagoides farinae TaxID=6954 RepID=A0A922I6K6_DERFA|nr:hypothetical protein DERF_005291 [Dermatophagoides farinae]